MLGVEVGQGKPSDGMAIDPQSAPSVFKPLELSNAVPILIYYKSRVTLLGDFQGIFVEVC
jgi:hypothetical protein